MWSVLTLHRWGLFRLATFFNQFFKQSNWKFRVRLRYGLSKVYPTFIKVASHSHHQLSYDYGASLSLSCPGWENPERSRCRRRRPPRWLRSRSAGGADIAAGLTAAAGTDPPWLIKFENLFFLICFFLFFEAKERNPKTSETKDIARELAVDRGSASQVGQDLWSLDSKFRTAGSKQFEKWRGKNNILWTPEVLLWWSRRFDAAQSLHDHIVQLGIR